MSKTKRGCKLHSLCYVDIKSFHTIFHVNIFVLMATKKISLNFVEQNKFEFRSFELIAGDVFRSKEIFKTWLTCLT